MFLPDNQWWQYQYYLTFYKYSKFECIGNFLCNKSWSQIVEEFILDFVLMSVPSVIRKNLRTDLYLYDKHMSLHISAIWFYIPLISGPGFVYNWITFRWPTPIGFLTRLKENNTYPKNRFSTLWPRSVAVCSDISSTDTRLISMISLGSPNKLGQ